MTAPQGPDTATAPTATAPPATTGTSASGAAPAGAGVPQAASPAQPPAPSATPATGSTSVLSSASRRPPPRSAAAVRAEDRARPAARARKARLALKRIDPWSVFVFSLIAAVLLGIALVTAVAALYAVLDGLGVQSSVNQLFAEVVDADGPPLVTSRRVVGGAAVLAAVNVVLLTLLATLGALLYNLCASFTGGVEVTLGERDG
ncbi:MAG: FIG187021: hypothetical protein [uncultured Frankineae bacterium]|uniref:DUF3566 domain-containing protein n=1 Tax=uncultured Frankineae bacterium TaxID=437475 RepID=A0A6J4LCR1_9ACTN|nr:MAG: FIG187021: hypothetical protein [uncultured Frankineae bacterium]